MTHNDDPTPLTLDDLAAIVVAEGNPGRELAVAVLRTLDEEEPGRPVVLGARQLALLVRWAAQTSHVPLFLARDLLDAEEEAK